jgi:hypothetical protein
MEDSRFEDLIEELRTLKIRETEIVAELNRVSKGASESRVENNEEDKPRVGIAKGDRVRVTNKVRKPASAGPTWTEAKERLATVTSVSATQVHILTDNGTKTWRGPNNLRLLQK